MEVHNTEWMLAAGVTIDLCHQEAQSDEKGSWAGYIYNVNVKEYDNFHKIQKKKKNRVFGGLKERGMIPNHECVFDEFRETTRK